MDLAYQNKFLPMEVSIATEESPCHRACNDVIKAAEDLRANLAQKQEEGQMPLEVALSFHETLNEIILKARELQKK
jgi:hypothetical protein